MNAEGILESLNKAAHKVRDGLPYRLETLPNTVNYGLSDTIQPVPSRLDSIPQFLRNACHEIDDSPKSIRNGFGKELR